MWKTVIVCIKSFMFKEMVQFKWNVESFSSEVCFRTSETMLSLFFCKCCFKWKHVFHSCDERYSFFFIVHINPWVSLQQWHLCHSKSIEIIKQMHRWLFTLTETSVWSAKLVAWNFNKCNASTELCYRLTFNHTISVKSINMPFSLVFLCASLTALFLSKCIRQIEL